MTILMIPSHDESEPPMTRFETSSAMLPDVHGGASLTSTAPTVARVLTFPVPAPVVNLPPHVKRIGDYVAEREQNEEFKKALSNARKDFARVEQQMTIRTMRLSKGMSQAQLAAAIGTSQPHIARIEGARLDPTYETFDKLARALDADIADVVHAFKVSKDAAPIGDIAL